MRKTALLSSKSYYVFWLIYLSKLQIIEKSNEWIISISLTYCIFSRYWLIYLAHLISITLLDGILSKNRLKALIMASLIPVRAANSLQSHLSSKAEAMVSSLTHPRVGDISSRKSFFSICSLSNFLNMDAYIFNIF